MPGAACSGKYSPSDDNGQNDALRRPTVAEQPPFLLPFELNLEDELDRLFDRFIAYPWVLYTQIKPLQEPMILGTTPFSPRRLGYNPVDDDIALPQCPS